MYQPTLLRENFIIKKLYTVHYFEFCKDYQFSGESHDFWELVYVDKGEIDILTEHKTFRLVQGEFIFHRPNEWHNVRATGKVAPNLVIVSFECKSPSMKYFHNKILNVCDRDKLFLSNIIKEAQGAFCTPLDHVYAEKLEYASHIPFGALQLIKINLEQLLISLYRNNNISKNNISVLRLHLDKDIVDLAIDYLMNNLENKIAFSDVVDYVQVSASTLKRIFKSKTQTGVMEYFISLKIERAKLFIRENNYNFTEISQILCYDTVHYFTKQFKQKTGMTPTEYSKSVKAQI